MRIQPLEDRIIIDVHEIKTATSGLYIPESAQEKPSAATVVSVGSGIMAVDGTRVPLEVKVGDSILFNKHAKQTIQYGNESFDMIFSRDVVAIIHEDEEAYEISKLSNPLA
jgi:chaperonin GroES